ncbi:formyltransferase family protein [Chitinivibrio alkaliphilus]|uniref:Methionyl-tRNA formyltranserase n=1 Tax=Chitinivibrio alkaliphilus ACht1 TaxID=1313304 RepID=U7DAS1_9BACT|nr:formyltransferase family protein [Chitinivibrio alkaliphilus]ERP39127.1 methionyl-tRNA formyltranserase [Chitinivibrio alkaliphilus ACht1]
MRVAVITEEDLFYVREFFCEFLPRARHSEYEICGVTILPAFNKGSTWALARQMYGFYGMRDFIRMGCAYAYRKFRKKTIRSLVEQERIPCIDVASVHSEAYLSWLKDEKIDVLVSVAAPVIFKKELLGIPPRGCLNSHSALLPENRGMMPVFWALYKDAPELGVTIHTMEEEVDRGHMLVQERVPIGQESLDEMIRKTKKISARLMDHVLAQMVHEDVVGTPIPAGGSYQTFPTPEEVRDFKKKGKRLL